MNKGERKVMVERDGGQLLLGIEEFEGLMHSIARVGSMCDPGGKGWS